MKKGCVNLSDSPTVPSSRELHNVSDDSNEFEIAWIGNGLTFWYYSPVAYGSTVN